MLKLVRMLLGIIEDCVVTCPSRDELSLKLMASNMFFSILLILISPAIGSFLGVVADRLPRGEDVVFKPSACRSCKRRLSAAHLLPVVSYIMQCGRCASCHASIPQSTFHTEILAIGAAVLAVLAGGSALEMATSAIWLWLLIALAVSDAVWFRLPDPLTLLLFVFAAAVSLMPHGIGAPAAISGAILGVSSFAILRWTYFKLRGRVGLGLGDVKLMGGIGAFCGPVDLPLLILIAALSSITFALFLHMRNRSLTATLPLPFGTALCFASAVMWLLQPPA